MSEFSGPIYLDYHATTPADPRVIDAMLPYFREQFGNASSESHAYGWGAKMAVEQARAQVAGLIGAEPAEIFFTSGATEANNIAILGTARAAASRRKNRNSPPHVITCATEHPAVLDAVAHLSHEGFSITVLPVDGNGELAPEAVGEAITADTVLISIMAANNEIGTLHDVTAIGEIARTNGIAFHTDATQAAGRIPLTVTDSPIDLLSLSAHKMYGPKGAGALFVRRNLAPRPAPLMFGGGQERKLRPGTLNVPGIVGLGVAAEIAVDELDREPAKLAALRDRLLAGLRENLDCLFVNGTMAKRLPNNLNVSIAFVDGEALMGRLTEIAVSSGSACSSASAETSHVLSAIRLPESLAQSSIRFGLGRFTTEAEIDQAAAHVARVSKTLREYDPRYELYCAGVDIGELVGI